MAYVENVCHDGPEGASFRQTLLVQQGEGAPVAVAEVALGPRKGAAGLLCRAYGQNRLGKSSVVLGAFQRLGVTRDASTVVFEVTDDFSLAYKGQLPAESEGIFTVRADGSGLRRLGDASRDACFRFSLIPLVFNADPIFAFSPDGRITAFTDVAPDLEPENAVQVATLDLASGARRLLTHLPPGLTLAPGRLSTAFPFYLSRDIIAFRSTANPQTPAHPDGANPEHQHVLFLVNTQTETLEAVPVVAAGGVIVPVFHITGAEPGALTLVVPGTPLPGSDSFGPFIEEAFTFDADSTLQLTTFGRGDTHVARLSADGQRVFFVALADPLGENPDGLGQLFSIHRLGGDLRQLTHFTHADDCGVSSVDFHRQDPLTQAVIFDSSCDPFGTNPHSEQLFAICPDGPGLRQLTHVRGMVTEDDGSVTVELVGPWAAPVRTR